MSLSLVAAPRRVFSSCLLSKSGRKELLASPVVSCVRHPSVIGTRRGGCLTSQASPPPTPPPATKKTSVMDVIKIRRQGKRKITMVTAYDYPSSVHVCRAGIDILLVGDSVGMVELGYDTTQPVTVDDMLHHCRVCCAGRYHAM